MTSASEDADGRGESQIDAFTLQYCEHFLKYGLFLRLRHQFETLVSRNAEKFNCSELSTNAYIASRLSA